MFILGMDIGYSNLKLAYGNPDDDAQVKVFPVGAAPTGHSVSGLKGNEIPQQGFLVRLGEEDYIAGIEPDRLANWHRALHQDYPSTKSYQALFYAALLATGVNTIDHLVTGLPVTQFGGGEKAKQLDDQLRGIHQPYPGRSVTVRKVSVVPQPVGCYLDAISHIGRSEEFNDAEVLVLDPGFFSFDWVLISEGDIQYRWSGTSTQATSMLLERAAQMIGEDYKTEIAVEKIERAIRLKREHVRAFGDHVDYLSYIEKAAVSVGSSVMDAVKTSLRSKPGNVDVVILAGGGAKYYGDAVRDVFPRAELIVSAEPVVANARGFWDFGRPE